ncbi:hypothetical protein QYM36_004357 [Artemia franciscana]|nr:hypothetical protein QYM36_004357 [Artemia franciscana]
MMGMKDAFLTQGDFNVISVDWSIDASSIDYFSSAYQVVNVGQTVAAFLDALIEYGTEIEDIHVIGSSLGAHVAGSTGAHLESGILPRITGLDPALPSYTIEGIDRRLDIGDAVFVDIIHTNMGSLLEGGLAFAEPIGHIDFYPNGGHEQPGCFDNVTDILDMIYACSHRRAVSYFTESINSNLFVSKECDSYENYVSGNCDSNTVAIMGNGVSTKASGTYYLRTNAESPFALGDEVFGQTKEERRL